MAKKKIIKKFPIIKDVILNNKGRQGAYKYVKLEVGKSASYYKIKKGFKNEDYLETKRFGIVAKKKGAVEKKTISRYIKKIKSGKMIEESLGKGVATHLIKNADKLTSYGIKISMVSLLTNKQNKFRNAIVRDKLLAEILTRPQNVLTYKHRLEYKIEVLGEGNKTIATIISAHKGKVLEEVVKDIKDNLKIGMTISGTYELKGFDSYNVTKVGDGKIKTINLSIIFRKG